MNNYNKLEEEINKIKERNAKVEADKAWETSLCRKALIAILTYFVIVWFFYSVDLPRPLHNAIVPTLGFVLSTLSISILKNVWMKYLYKKDQRKKIY
jgi:hypothetical protein